MKPDLTVPPKRPSPERVRQMRELAAWHDEWTDRHLDEATFTQRPVGSDYPEHYLDVDGASVAAEDEFQARARQIMGLGTQESRRPSAADILRIAEAHWDPALHPRNKDGTFRTLLARVTAAVLAGDDKELNGLNRRQLLDVAKGHDVHVRRGMSDVALRNEIKARIHADNPRGTGRADTPSAPPKDAGAAGAVPAYSPPKSLSSEDRARAERLVRADPQIYATVQDRLGRISSSGNLSEADAAWLQSVFEREPAFVNRLAQTSYIEANLRRAAKNAGQTPTEFKNTVADKLRETFADKPIAVRVSDEAALRSILKDGRVKTQFDAGVKRTGHLRIDADRRRLGEQVAGVAPDTPAEQRPVYGYVAINGVEPALSAGKKIPGIAQMEGQEDLLSTYGKVQVVLKPEVRSRTTATIGDSLDQLGMVQPSPVDNPTAYSANPGYSFKVDNLDELKQPGWTRRSYVEAQVHGGVRSSDIAEVVFPSDPDPATRSALDGAGIPWRVLTPGGATTPAKATKKAARKAAAPRGASRAPAKPAPIHDLINAPDAEIEAALKDVYEGKFGPYTTKVRIGIRRPGTKVGKSQRELEQSIWVEGKVYDAAGHEIGNFERSIGPEKMHYPDGTVRRELWAEHSIVQLDPKYQGKGFGGEFNRRAIDWYRSSGVHGISQSDHNFYVWASQGFNFDSGVMPEYKAEELRRLIADLRAGSTKNQYGETIPKGLREAPNLDAQIAAAEDLLTRLETTKPGQPGYPTAYEVSQLGRARGQRGKTAIWLGKFLGVAAGEMILNPDEGEVINP